MAFQIEFEHLNDLTFHLLQRKGLANRWFLHFHAIIQHQIYLDHTQNYYRNYTRENQKYHVLHQSLLFSPQLLNLMVSLFFTSTIMVLLVLFSKMDRNIHEYTLSILFPKTRRHNS